LNLKTADSHLADADGQVLEIDEDGNQWFDRHAGRDLVSWGSNNLSFRCGVLACEVAQMVRERDRPRAAARTPMAGDKIVHA
jgi:hypothetical protein